MSITRRTFVRATVSSMAVSTGMGAGIFASRSVAAALPAQTFFATSPDAAISAVLGTDQSTPDPAVELDVAGMVETADVVPVSVSTTLDDVSSITIVADNNPNPIIAHYRLDPRLQPYVATRVRLAKSGDVRALVMAGKSVHSTSKNVEISISGCGDPEADPQPGPRDKTMSDAIRMKLTKADGGVVVRALVTHPMTPPRNPAAQGSAVSGAFINEVRAELNGKTVLTGEWSAGVAQNPYLAFKIRQATPGDVIRLSWTDSAGNNGSSQATVDA